MSALTVVADQLREGIGARKCHSCGCFQAAVAAFEKTDAGRAELAEVLERARSVLVERMYDCLGCKVCYPAIAENAFADAFPGEAVAPRCPADAPVERRGWPPLPGDYTVLRFGAPVAVCTLNSAELSEKLAAAAPQGLALTGALHTENLGIERIIRNVLANPHLRFLVVCGEDTRQAIGHLPGQTLVALCENGVGEAGRIRGAAGRRPILKNVTAGQIEAFRSQIELVDLVGESNVDRVMTAVSACAARDPGPSAGPPADEAIPTFVAQEPTRLVLDPSGFLVVYPDGERGLVLEHYRNDGTLDCVVEGRTPSAVGAAAVERGLVSRLDHAIYLGRELARAESSLRTGEPYVQDRAPGSSTGAAAEPECGKGCGCAGKT
jgi:tetrahydromethanopterin S-methyltransferase subunit A